jgi:hypothetical protein
MLSTSAPTVARRSDRPIDPAAAVLRTAVVGLTLSTAAVHLSLGGVLFTVNAIGYAGLAAAMVLPGPLASVRWLVRLALLGFTFATVVGWLMFGARFPLAYVDKALELALVALLLGELWLLDGGPRGVARRARGLGTRAFAAVAGGGR